MGRARLRVVLPVLWLVLTLTSGLANWYAWGHPDQATGRTGRLDVMCKYVSNTAQAVNAPVWFVAWYGLQRYTSFQAALVVNGIGFAFWVGAAAVVLEARRRIRTKRPADSHAHDGEVIPTTALTRRAFITDSVLVTGTVCAGAAGAYASFVTPWSLKVARYTGAIKGLPRGLDGLRMVQVTDTHLGPRIPAGFVSEAVELALSLKPDLYLLTGDYVHMGPAYVEPAAALFRPLTERRPGCIGVVGVLGNHDYYADARAMSGALEDMGVRMVTNGRLFLDAMDRELSVIPRRAESVCIAGVDDLLEGEIDVEAALRGVPEEMARVMLSHNPDVAEARELVGKRVDLMISGHTHGGQVVLPLIGNPAIPSRYGQKYAYGRVQGPECPVLISAGVGMSLVPVRIGVRPEVVEITLRSA